MNKSHSIKILGLLISLSLCLIVIHLALKYVSVVIFEEKHGFIFELSNRFDLNDENSVPQWMSQTIFLVTGLGSFLVAYMTKQRSAKNLWLLFGIFTVLLSLDDASTMHEFILQTIHNTFFVDTAPSLLRNAWLVVAPIVFVVVLWLIIKMFRTFPRRSTYLLALGMITFFVGALAVDSIVNTVPERSFMGQGLYSAIEGGLQLVGASTLLYAVADYIERYHQEGLKAALARIKA